MAMNRIINNADLVVEDMLKGWLLAHADTVVGTDNSRVVKRARAPEAGKVGIVTGGGSGHEPAFLGYVGDGMVDAVAIGEIFSSPTAKSFLDAMRAANGGAGVACLYGNYAGDNMNVKMAMAMAEREGIAVKTVVANDDVPSAPKGEEAKRRGVAGEILMWKVGAAKAAMGGSLDEVISAAQKAIDNTRSIGIGLSACIIPAVGHANFTIEKGKMEVGIGHHGEPGIDVRETVSAAEMADLMLKTNPCFVLRNHLAEQAIRAAKLGDLSVLQTLQRLLARPFDEHPGFEAYADFPPDWASSLSISCSS